jgi:hypothetical protein
MEHLSYRKKILRLTPEKLREFIRPSKNAYDRYVDLTETVNLCGKSLEDIDAIRGCVSLRVLYADGNCM